MQERCFPAKTTLFNQWKREIPATRHCSRHWLLGHRGYITGWSALTRFASTDIAIQYLKHDITFQLWRSRARSSGVYDFVGSHHLGFIGNTLRSGTTVVGGTQYFNFSSAQPQSSGQSPLYFRPGDVVGWYIHTLVQSIDIPLTVVYKDTPHPVLRSVDMYKTVIDNAISRRQPPCEISLNSDRTTRISSVIPYVNVDYGKPILIILFQSNIR